MHEKLLSGNLQGLIIFLFKIASHSIETLKHTDYSQSTNYMKQKKNSEWNEKQQQAIESVMSVSGTRLSVL